MSAGRKEDCDRESQGGPYGLEKIGVVNKDEVVKDDNLHDHKR